MTKNQAYEVKSIVFLYLLLFWSFSLSSHWLPTVKKSGGWSLPYLHTASFIYEHCQNGTRDNAGTQKIPLGQLPSSSERLLVYCSTLRAKCKIVYKLRAECIMRHLLLHEEGITLAV